MKKAFLAICLIAGLCSCQDNIPLAQDTPATEQKLQFEEENGSTHISFDSRDQLRAVIDHLKSTNAKFARKMVRQPKLVVNNYNLIDCRLLLNF